MPAEHMPRRMAGYSFGNRLMAELDQSGKACSPKIVKRGAFNAQSFAGASECTGKAFGVQMIGPARAIPGRGSLQRLEG